MAGKGKELKTTITLEGAVGTSVQKAFDKVNGMMSKAGNFAGGVMKAGFAAAAAGIATVGSVAVAGTKAALDLGQEFQNASNTIRIQTGATGEALDALNSSFDEVYKSVPTTMEAASQAISDYNTRLGLTGTELETISKQSILLSNMMGEDLTGVIESSSQAFKQWNINAEDMDEEMDYIYKVCQSTGMGFNDLMKNMQSSGAVLQDLGYNFDEAASMIANLDKAGINTEQVLKGMKKGLGNIAKDGGDAVAAMSEYAESIRNAKSESEAITIAADIFGSATAVTMAQAIRTGAMDVDALTASLQANDETIMKAAEDTETFPQKLQKLKATAQVALKPVANSFIDIANKAIPMISDAMENIIPKISGILSNLAPAFEDVINGIFPVISSVVEQTTLMFDNVLTAVPQVFEMIKGTAGQILPLASNIIPMIHQGINGIMSAVQMIAPYVQQIIGSAIPMIRSIGEAIMPIVSTLMTEYVPVLMQMGGILMDTLTPIITQIFDTITAMMPVIAPFIQSAITMVSTLYQRMLPIADFLGKVLVGTIQNILTVVTPVVAGIITAFTGLMDFVTGVFTGNWDKAWEGIGKVFIGIWNSMKGIVQNVLNGIIKGFNTVIGGINGVVGAAGDVIGLNLKIPTIPLVAFAKGGTVTSPTLAMIGEGGSPETVIPHDSSVRSRSLLNEAARGVYGAGATVTNGGSDNRTYNITFSPVIQGAGLTDKDLQETFEKFKRFMARYDAENTREAWT